LALRGMDGTDFRKNFCFEQYSVASIQESRRSGESPSVGSKASGWQVAASGEKSGSFPAERPVDGTSKQQHSDARVDLRDGAHGQNRRFFKGCAK
jgi:hypothetical protein